MLECAPVLSDPTPVSESLSEDESKHMTSPGERTLHGPDLELFSELDSKSSKAGLGMFL